MALPLVSVSQEAKWLTINDFKHTPNQWFQLRKSINLSEVPENVNAKISADSKYWLWINGVLVVREGMLKRGPNPNDTYYDQLDLTGYLKEGNNTIAALVWYFGKEGFSHKDSKKFGFLFDGEAGSTAIVSDATWKINRDLSYGTITEGKVANWRLSEGDVIYDARNENGNWMQPDYDDSTWSNALEAGTEGSAPWNNLVQRPIPLWKDFGLKKTTDLKRKGNRVTMKLPYNMQFSYWIEVRAAEGRTIDITTDTYEWLNDTPIRSRYITKQGIQEYEHHPWMSGHEVIFELDDEVELLEAGYRETGYDTQIDGKFEIDDPFLMQFIEKANRTLYVNMRDTYFDCPDRERAQWWGDLVQLMEESFFVFDTAANALSLKAIKELVDWQKADSVIFSPIPAGNWDKELPHQMLAAIGVGFKNYFLYTGDTSVYRYVYPKVKKYLNLWQVDQQGKVIAKKRDWWGWYDHGTQIDSLVLEHAWYHIALNTYSEMANIMGEPNESQKAVKAMERIKSFVNANYWTEEGYRAPGYTDEIDDRGSAIMVVAGIAGPDKYEVIANLLRNVRHSSPYIDKYQLEALFIMGKNQQALERIRSRYGKMVEDPDITTLWESFDGGNWSYNHAWSGGPYIMMYQYLAGIKPVKPGFEQFEVFPELRNYNKLNCNFSTVRGRVSMNYEINNEAVSIHVTVPHSAEGIVRVPKMAKKIAFSGAGNYHLIKDKTDPDYEYYVVSAGDWDISYSNQ